MLDILRTALDTNPIHQRLTFALKSRTMTTYYLLIYPFQLGNEFVMKLNFQLVEHQDHLIQKSAILGTIIQDGLL
jgi:hypothetical protein